MLSFEIQSSIIQGKYVLIYNLNVYKKYNDLRSEINHGIKWYTNARRRDRNGNR